ncbi:MAG: hypothetical protein WCV72_01720 [Patescibacteria group bacterium]
MNQDSKNGDHEHKKPENEPPSWKDLRDKARKKLEDTLKKKLKNREKGSWDKRISRGARLKLNRLFDKFQSKAEPEQKKNKTEDENSSNTPDSKEPPKQKNPHQAGAEKNKTQRRQPPEDNSTDEGQSNKGESTKKSPQQKNQKAWEKKFSMFLYRKFEKLKGIGGFAYQGLKKIRRDNKEHILDDDKIFSQMPPSRFEEAEETTRFGEKKKVDRLMDYFGRTNRDPFKHNGDWLNPDMREIKIVVNSIDSNLRDALGDILNKFKKEIDPAFGHAKVEPLELISDLEMLNGNICTLGIVSSHDLAQDVAARLETGKSRDDIAEKISGGVVDFFTKNWKRKTTSTAIVLALSMAANPLFLGTFFVPKARRLIFEKWKKLADREAPQIDSEKIYKLLQSKDLKALRALSLGKGYNLEINNLPRKMRWLEIGTGWCFLPSVKKDSPDQALVYRDKAIVARDTGATVNPKFIVKSPAAWEVFFQHIGKKYDNGTDLPLNGKVFTDDIKATGSKFFLPPDIGTVQNLDLTNVAGTENSLRVKTLREIKGDVTIPSNEVLEEFPNGVIYRGNKENLQNLDQEVVRKKFKFAEADKKPEPEAEVTPEAKVEAETKTEPNSENKPKPEADTKPSLEQNPKLKTETEAKPESEVVQKPEANLEFNIKFNIKSSPEAKLKTDSKPESEAKPEPDSGNKPKPEDKDKPDSKQKKHPAKKMRSFFTKIKDAWKNS